jgi:hypothetical protein
MLEYKGTPVPWIARWTSEVRSPGPEVRLEVTDKTRISYAHEREDDRIEGVLWLREGSSQGVGEPLFKEVHSHRQRQCIVDGLCQVCGQSINGSVIPWILPRHLSEKKPSGIVTEQAPICEACISVATKYCPYLLGPGYKTVDVTGYRPIALFGDVWEVGREGSGSHHYQADRPVGGYLGNLVARQMIVQLWAFRNRRKA